jgi:DNA-binding response OmpR family regulator
MIDELVNFLDQPLARFLRRASYKVILAMDGMTGVGAAQEHTPDLIVMDLGLPGMKTFRRSAGPALIY